MMKWKTSGSKEGGEGGQRRGIKGKGRGGGAGDTLGI